MGLGVSQNLKGTFVGVAVIRIIVYILGPILGSPYIGKLPCCPSETSGKEHGSYCIIWDYQPQALKPNPKPSV